MNKFGMLENDVLAELERRASMDTTFDSGMIFNTECCNPHPLAVKAYNMFMDRNVMKEQNPSVNNMEVEVIQMLSSLFNSEDNSGFNGYVASGGTEANIVAFWAAKAANPDKNTIIAPRHAHYSKNKIEMLLGLNVIEVPVSRDFKVNPKDIESLVDSDTLGIFATAGTSRLGVIDPIEDLAEIADKHDIHLHIDGAYGGFLIPFLHEAGYDVPNIGFDAGADSITLDPHKFGLCPLGSGVVLFKDKELLDGISYVADFPKINNRTFQGSRSGGPVAATWTMLNYLGTEGYKSIALELMDKRDYIVSKLADVPEIEYVTDPQLTALGLTYKNQDFETLKLAEYMHNKGFKITPDANPNSLRIIVHSHIEYEHIDNLVENLKDGVNKINNEQDVGSLLIALPETNVQRYDHAVNS